jgi:small-conductance mechanosensitive channel
MIEQLTELFSPERLALMVVQFTRALAILLGAFIVSRVMHRVVRALRERTVAVMRQRAGGTAIELEKRAATIGGIIRKSFAAVIWFVAILMALKEVGFDVAPILAGAGVVGLAVGFGAQNLVRDVISGLFILMENQVRVNDVAVINGTGGLVEEINLRTTVLRSLDGVVHVFPNGAITSLANMTREFSYYVFDIGVAYKEDTDRVVQVLHKVSEEMMNEEPYRSAIIQPLEVLGVDAFANSAVMIKARIKTQPLQQWLVGREMNRRIKKAFDQAGIEIPFPHLSVYFGEASKPFRVTHDGDGRTELRQVVREVMLELRQAEAGRAS